MAPVNKKLKTQNKNKKKQKQENEETENKETVVSGQLIKKVEKKQQLKNIKKERGVVLIKHLPHGFFEEQLKNYFEQFGKVTRLRLVRSKKTGGSKGFAFVEFEYPEVAQVAAETMDNYLMFQKLVKAAYIPPDKQLYNYFKTTVRKVKNSAGKPIFVSNKTAAIKHQAKVHNEWTEDKTTKLHNANLKKIKKLNEKYADLGIDFSTICMNGSPAKSQDEDATVNQKVNKKPQVNESLALEDLLGATIQEDSEDEDWQGDDVSEDEYASSLYLDDDDDSENESENVKPVAQTVKKSAKPKVAKEEKLGKSKQHFGGIQKMSKKTTMKKSTAQVSKQAKNPLMAKMVKETAKPMANITRKPKSIKKKK